MGLDPDLLWNVVVPVAEIVAAIVVCAGLALWLGGVMRRLEEEQQPGRLGCPKCGYDIRATPERCPECGTAPPPPEEADDDEGAPNNEVAMPVYSIPDDAGPFVVVRGNDGNFAVADERATGGPGHVFIPCRDEAQAKELCDRLSRGDHDGTVQVNLLDTPTAPAPEADRA